MQLLELGFTRRQIERRLGAGRLIPLHRGVYAVGHRPRTRQATWMAAVLACGPGAALSHTSAAALHGLLPSSPSIHVTLPVRSGRARPGIRVHRAASLHPTDVDEVDGIRVTPVARTLLDLAASDPRRLPKALGEAEFLRVLDVQAIDEVVARLGSPRGKRALEQALGRHDPVVIRSKLERRFKALVEKAGLPKPAHNAHVAIPDGPAYEIDPLWPRHRLAVELDSRAVHARRAAFQRDRTKDQDLTAAGYRPLRFTWHDITRDKERTERLLNAVLEAKK